jgi:hypothetical protein
MTKAPAALGAVYRQLSSPAAQLIKPLKRTALTAKRTALIWALAGLRRLRSGRRTWHRAGLFAAELAGVVLVSYGIAQWSWPSAVIVGGLVMVAAIEVRPSAADKLPVIPPPEDVLRRQAESAAILINNERFGLAFVDPDQLARLTIAECEQLIILARSLGVKT